jgi:hypothetical protein
MPFYRKRPVVIDANEWVGGVENASYLIDWVLANGGNMCYVDYNEDGEEVTEYLQIETSTGSMKAQVGDFIVRGARGEFYPWNPGIFHKTYERM